MGAESETCSGSVPQVFDLPDTEIWFHPALFDAAESDRLFTTLLQETPWKQEDITLYGQTMRQPRLTAWYGEASYTYSGLTLSPAPWTATLSEIKTRIESLSHLTFNSVLLNLYRNGNDSVSWHSDDEPELGKNPAIASVSFGATRRFMLRHKSDKSLKKAIDLPHGSFLLMRGETQHHWQHQIPKTAKLVQPRINLTYRVVRE
ncbi:MAG: alpha-ketoglutarate-dependent dioxygenase AlkB [Oculatellaceae cyanobacterium Prado106]|nr:alpha-ketoglutarate-dependent dioxygenase AlkB [Oculatellaceae cyanobacterium Prado106]